MNDSIFGALGSNQKNTLGIHGDGIGRIILELDKQYSSIVLVVMFLVGCGGKNDPITQAEKKDADKPSIAEIKAIAEDGFIYGLPIVMNYAVMYDFCVNKDSDQYTRKQMPSFADRIVPEEGHSSLRTETSADVATEVTTTAKARILHHPHLKEQRIWCEFDGGKLFVRGQVPSFFYKQLAQEAVQRIRGVGQVLNEIEVVW